MDFSIVKNKKRVNKKEARTCHQKRGSRASPLLKASKNVQFLELYLIALMLHMPGTSFPTHYELPIQKLVGAPSSSEARPGVELSTVLKTFKKLMVKALFVWVWATWGW